MKLLSINDSTKVICVVATVCAPACDSHQLLQESSDVLEEMKSVVNINGLSMSDKERMDVIDRTYNSIRNYRDLVSYYTRKNISVSYLRAKKKKDTDRVMALYGSADERYW